VEGSEGGAFAGLSARLHAGLAGSEEGLGVFVAVIFLEAFFDEGSDGFGSGLDAAGEAEVIDLVEEGLGHGDDDAFWGRGFGHGLKLHPKQRAV
jgi:hypothetical protein